MKIQNITVVLPAKDFSDAVIFSGGSVENCSQKVNEDVLVSRLRDSLGEEIENIYVYYDNRIVYEFYSHQPIRKKNWKVSSSNL